jgi:hypothetical protein
MLEARQAVFLNYHDPDIPLQEDDVRFYRYHPLLLNAAFLGNLSAEDERILGFGNKKNYIPAFERPTKPFVFYRVFSMALTGQLYFNSFKERVRGRLRRSR